MIASQANDWQEFDRLIDGACDGTLSADQWTKLGQWLIEYPEARVHYLACMDVHGTLAWQMMPKTRLSPVELQQYTQAEIDLLSTEDGCSSDGSLPVSPGLGFLSTTLHGTVGYFSSGWPVAYLMATAIFGIGILVGSHVYVSQSVQVAQRSAPLPSPLSPLPSMVGRITGMVDCQWAEGSGFSVRGSELPSPAGRGAGGEGDSDGLHPSSFIPHPSSLVSLGDTFALASGLLEITYDTGAKVILQGPVTYEVESKDGGFLSLGKLTARVDKKGSGFSGQGSEISKTQDPRPHPLFAVRTPTATVTDLGTEFGVEVTKSGETTSHVFRGTVRVQVVPAVGQADGNGQILRENESARVAGRGNDRRLVVVSSTQRVEFVREIPKVTIKTFDLVDVVAGGDGFSGRRGHGIDATNGRPTDAWPKDPDNANVTGDGKYHRAQGLPFVDGVFVPDGRLAPVRIDSAGHTFADCPETCNQTGFPVWAGGTLPFAIRTEMGGIDYAASGHGLVFLHANRGITFNLDAIRRANPGHRILRFQALVGDSADSTMAHRADIWVLVDGRVQFQRYQITGNSGAFVVVVPLGEKDHFLTLAATDGGDGIKYDWIIFGDPRIELLPRQP